MINGSTSIPLADGADYVQVALTGPQNEVTVGPIPAGDGYQVILVLGRLGDPSGVFIPESYVTSEEVSVYAGEASEITLVPETSPFVPIDPGNTLGLNMIGMVFDGTNLYAATPDEIMSVSGVSMASLGTVVFGTTAQIPGTEVANSITLGALPGGAVVPYLNTNEGILPYDGTFDTSFDADSGINREILDSGGFTDGFSDLYAYFQYDGGLGGVWWPNAGSPEWLSEIDLSEYVSGQPVYDLDVELVGANVYGYFASKLGAFRLADDLLRDTAVDTVQQVLNYPSTILISAMVDGLYAPITQIQVIGGGNVFLGTTRGVVLSDVTALEAAYAANPPQAILGDSSDPSSMVVESRGRYVEEILAGGLYVAIQTTQFLIVSRDGGMTFAAVPLVASCAGEVTGMFLDTLSGVVLVAGSTGVAGMNINTVAP